MKELMRTVGLTFLLDQKVRHSAYWADPVSPVFASVCDFNVVQRHVAGYAYGFTHPVAVQLPWQLVADAL